jgi:hypothetical protein
MLEAMSNARARRRLGLSEEKREPGRLSSVWRLSRGGSACLRSPAHARDCAQWNSQVDRAARDLYLRYMTSRRAWRSAWVFLTLSTTGCLSIPLYLATGRYHAVRQVGGTPGGPRCGLKHQPDQWPVYIELYCNAGDECISEGSTLCQHEPDRSKGQPH